MTSLCRLFYCIKKGWGQGWGHPSKPLFHYVYKPYYIRRQRQPDLRKFVGEGIFCRRRRMVQGRGSTNSSAKANFAFADEWFKVGGRQIRRQRQILPLRRRVQGRGSANSSAILPLRRRVQGRGSANSTKGSRSGVGKFVGKGKFCLCDEWFQAEGLGRGGDLPESRQSLLGCRPRP